MSTKIKHVHARQVMDCKFRPVIEVDVELENGIVGRGAAPTGSSVGSYEAEVKLYPGISAKITVMVGEG